MLIEKIWIKAVPLLRVKHQATNEVVDGDDRESLGDEDGFGFGKKMKALCRVRFGKSSAQKGVIGGVRPTRSIVPSASHEAVEEGVGVVVISNPTGACDIKIKFIQGAQVGSPLLVAEFHFHPENTLPLGLNFYRNLLV